MSMLPTLQTQDPYLERLPLLLREAFTHYLPEPWHTLSNQLISIVVILSVFGLLFAILTLAERKILGHVQNRPGPNRTGFFGMLQPFADGIKMLTKEDIVPVAADHVLHLLAPVSLLAASILTFAVIPYGKNLVALDINTAALYFFAVGSATELSVFMAGWSSNNKYSLLAAMRALAQLISYELPLIISWIPVVMVASTLSLTRIVSLQSGYSFGVLPHWYVFTPWGFVAFALFMVSALAESNRSPFDLPEAESELIAGHLTEYSGFKYALFFMAEYFGMTALSGMAVSLFLGGWNAPSPYLTFIPSYLWFAVKLLSLLAGFMWIRATFPRLRIDQLTRFAWKFLVPLSLINLVTTAFWILSQNWGHLYFIPRLIITLILIVVPYILLSKKLGRGYAVRTYSYAPQ